MATLQKIRNRAGLLIIVVGVALFAFIIGDGLRSGSSILQDNKAVALNIDGKKIKYDEFQKLLSSRTEGMEAQRQLSERDRAEISNQLSQELIADQILEQEAKALGLRITADELSALIYGQGLPVSQYAVQFFSQFNIDPMNAAQVQAFMSDLDLKKIESLPAEQQGMVRAVRNQWLEVEKGIRRQRLSEKFNALMTRSYAINSLDEKYTTGLGSRTVAVVRTPSTLLSNDEVTISDQEVNDYYNSHKELFRFPLEQASIRYFSTQIRPSDEDFAAAKEKVAKARQELLGTQDPARVVRNYDNAFSSDFYFTDKELEQALSSLPNAMSLLREGAIGDVNDPIIINDSYTLIKLVDRKSAPEKVRVSLVVLDSVNAPKADSLINALHTGATSFAAVVEGYSVDPQTKANKGYLVNVDQYSGLADSTFTQSQLYGMGLDTMNHVPVNQPIKINRGTMTLIVRTSDPLPAVNHYKVAQLSVPVQFSEKTYQDRYAVINNIFASQQSFDKMIEEAEKTGLNVVKEEYLNTRTSELANIPNSHEIVSWALRSKEGAISDKLFRCGEDYLVVAQVTKKIEPGIRPIAQVEKQIRDRLTMEHRGDQLAEKLAAKKLNSLQAYANEMGASIDTLYAVSYVTTPRTPATLIGQAMTTPIGQISSPFRADTEVIVAQPISETKDAISTSPAALAQQRRAYGQQMAYRALQELIARTKIEDTRYRFW